MPEATLIIFKSKNGRDGWEPVLPADVPEFVKKPTTIGRLVEGQMAMNPQDGENAWYRAEQLPKEDHVADSVH